MKPVKAANSFVDDKKVSDHHAIIPTEQFVQLDHMTNEERKIYDLVVRRFCSVLYPPFEYEQTTIKGQAAGENLHCQGKDRKNQGWKEAYDGEWTEEEDEEFQTLKELEKGQHLKIDRADITHGKSPASGSF